MKFFWLLGLMLAITSAHGVVAEQNSPTVFRQEISTGWVFREASTREVHPATVPGCVHTDLIVNKLIPDPYFGTNEADVQWVGEKDWVYQTKFTVSSEMLGRQFVDIIFKGLDTYATVHLNDSLLLRADNMFREWRVDARPFLRPGENTISISFRNVFGETVPRYKSAPFELQAAANNDQGDPRVAMYSRKAQFHFGWDWGPRLVTCGIWKPVVIEAWDAFRFGGVHIVQRDVSRESATILSRLDVVSSSTQSVAITITVDGKTLASERHVLKEGSNSIELKGTIQKPNLWWSNGLGSQYLYAYEAAVTVEDGAFDTYASNLGVRSLKVVRDADSSGTSMYVLLNGVPVFMKGANYIPLDNFQNRVTKERHKYIVRSAADAHMNMLRVWGGGIFEDDSFFDMCDKYGILVWQDMLFACAMYPGTDEFLASVRAEVVDNVKRIRNHPSLALYCGNNENEAGWYSWGWKERYSPEVQAQFETDMRRLYYETIPSALREADSSRYYHPSSPIAGFARKPKGDGDTHYWDVWHGQAPFEKFEENVSRFVSEYGFQSYPELASIEKFTVPADRDLNSAVMLSHQRCMADERKDKQFGNRLIKSYMDRYYKEPKDFASYLHISQVLQALGMQTAIEAHRRNMPYCMGSLYWQINDCWPVASWSGIDYYGTWKALHYAAKRSFTPVLIAPKLDGKTVDFYIVSDELAPLKGDLQIQVRGFNGKVIYNKRMPLTVLPNTSRSYLALSKKRLLGGAREDRVVLVTRFTSKRGAEAENLTYFKYPKDLRLEKAKIGIKAKKGNEGIEITLTTSTLARNIRLTCDGADGFFTDNYFDLLPRKRRTIIFRTDASVENVAKNIRAVSLADTF